MSLEKTDIEGDEIWIADSQSGDTVVFIESVKSNQFTMVFLKLDELRELRTVINEQIMSKTFKTQKQ